MIGQGLGMRHAWIPLALGLLAGCGNSPAWQMTGAPSQTVRVGAHEYTVYWQDKKFEVVRHGYARRAEQSDIRETMLLVVKQVTGCTPLVDTGDSGEARGKLTSCSR